MSRIMETGMGKNKEWVLLWKLVWVKKKEWFLLQKLVWIKEQEWVLLQKLVWVKNKNESYYRNWYE